MLLLGNDTHPQNLKGSLIMMRTARGRKNDRSEVTSRIKTSSGQFSVD